MTLLAGAGRRILRLLCDPNNAPCTAEQDTRAVIFDGTLNNRNQLLSLTGARFRSRPSNDAELVLRAHSVIGSSVLNKIRGNWALVIWDDERRELLAARDHFGVYPLFYAQADDVLLLSPVFSSIARHRAVTSHVNRGVVAGWLWGRWVDSEETFISAVRRVPAGCVLEEKGGIRHISRYWDPQVVERETDAREAWETFDHLVCQAVERCMSGGRAGIFLSGGVDSATVAALATEISRARSEPDPLALSLRLPHPDCDESPRQKDVAARLRIPQIFASYDEAFGPDGMLLVALRGQTASMPSISPWEPAYSFLAREAKQRGCAVILSGEGGNHWFDVDPLHAADLLRGLDFRGLLSFWDIEQKYLHRPPLEMARLLLWTFGARPLLQTPFRVFLEKRAPHIAYKWQLRRNAGRIPRWIAPDDGVRHDMVERFVNSKPAAPTGKLHGRARRARLENSELVAYKEASYERSTQLGVSLLDPLHDVDLVEFLLQIPPQLLNFGGRAKGLAKASLRKRLPGSSIAPLTPVSMDGFFTAALNREAKNALDTLGGVPTLVGLGLVDEGLLYSVVEKGRYDEDTNCYHVWQALASEAWLRSHLVDEREEKTWI